MAIALAGGGLIYQQVQTDATGCDLPNYPTLACTGVPDGTSLTAYSGPSDITSNGTTIDSKTIGCLTVHASNVTIRNSRITCSGSAVTVDDDSGNYTRSSSGTVKLLTIEDSEIDCGDTAGSHGIAESHVLAVRVEIRNCENGMSLNSNTTIQDSVIHDLARVGADPHEDGIQLSFGHWNGSTYVCCSLNITIQHNKIEGYTNDDTLGTSAIISNPEKDTNTLITQNLMSGGASTIYCTRPGNSVAENYRLIDNAFSKEFSPTYGAFGLDDDCEDETNSGNFDYDTGDPLDFTD